MFSLKGKVAVVTGSDRGIGKGIAKVLGSAGAVVVISSRKKERCSRTVAEMKAEGIEAFAITCDVSREKDVERLVRETARKFGRIDIFVSNAGVLLQKPADAVSGKEMDWLLGINLKGVLYGTKHAAAQMKKQKGGGSIVNVSSIAAISGYAMLSTYCASKGGVNAFTRAAALDLAPHGIRVNAVCPGMVESDMTKGMVADEKGRQESLSTIPLRIIGQPEDIGHSVLYLASDEARYVTGVALVVDGGTSVE